jgi:hypothetical protein
MGVRVNVRENEPVAQAICRLQTVIRVERHRNFKWFGPQGWMILTKEYHQKPSVVRRIKEKSREIQAKKKAARQALKERNAVLVILSRSPHHANQRG